MVRHIRERNINNVTYITFILDGLNIFPQRKHFNVAYWVASVNISLWNPLNEGHTYQNMSGYFISYDNQ